jgi:TPR repeat protein
MYHEGRGVKGDIYEAEKWFNKAIEQENPNAQYNLAMIIMSKSMGTEDDKAKVDELLKKAADQDHLQAQILWASMGKYGADKALHVIRKAAAANNEQGMLQLGDLYYKGKYGLEKNYYETVKWWSKAADLGSISARKELGEMYFYGRNNEKGEIVMSIDKQKAVALYKVAAESNIKTITPDEIIDLYFVLDVSHRAQQKVQRRLGDIYLEGDGVLQDKKTAKRYFGMACINGSDYSCEKYKKIK